MNLPRVKVDGCSAAALIRLGLLDSGYAYLESALSLGADGSAEIVDRYDYSTSMDVEDAGLRTVKVVTLLSAEECDKAISVAERALVIELRYENAYWALLNAQVESRRSEDGAPSARFLEDVFEYEFTAEAMSDLDTFVPFIPFIPFIEFREWRAERLSGQ